MGFLPKKPLNLACSFCGQSQLEVRKLIAGPTVYICDACVAKSWSLIRGDDQPSTTPRHRIVEKSERVLCCSFCGKKRTEVEALVAGPTVYICNECLGLCDEIIAEELSLEDPKPKA